jgi:hypothetical protein
VPSVDRFERFAAAFYDALRSAEMRLDPYLHMQNAGAGLLPWDFRSASPNASFHHRKQVPVPPLSARATGGVIIRFMARRWIVWGILIALWTVCALAWVVEAGIARGFDDREERREEPVAGRQGLGAGGANPAERETDSRH